MCGVDREHEFTHLSRPLYAFRKRFEMKGGTKLKIKWLSYLIALTAVFLLAGVGWAASQDAWEEHGWAAVPIVIMVLCCCIALFQYLYAKFSRRRRRTPSKTD